MTPPTIDDGLFGIVARDLLKAQIQNAEAMQEIARLRALLAAQDEDFDETEKRPGDE